MKISLLQTDIAWNDPAENVRRCSAAAREAVAAGSQLLVFPEMFTCGFSLPTGELALQSQEDGLRFLRSLAYDDQVFCVGSLPELAADGTLYNTAWLIGPNGVEHSYRKVHLFSYGEEQSIYSAGSTYQPVTIEGLRCTVFICYDLRFAMPFHQLAPKTDLFIVVANWPVSRREHWLTLLKARAIENQAFVAGVNRVGEGGGLHYVGDSVIFGPDGSLRGHLGTTPSTLAGIVDPTEVTTWRTQFPTLRDRRPAIYAAHKDGVA